MNSRVFEVERTVGHNRLVGRAGVVGFVGNDDWASVRFWIDDLTNFSLGLTPAQAIELGQSLIDAARAIQAVQS